MGLRNRGCPWGFLLNFTRISRHPYACYKNYLRSINRHQMWNILLEIITVHVDPSNRISQGYNRNVTSRKSKHSDVWMNTECSSEGMLVE